MILVHRYFEKLFVKYTNGIFYQFGMVYDITDLYIKYWGAYYCMLSLHIHR